MNKRKQLEHAITRLESQRDILGDEAVDEAIDALRTKLSAIEHTEEQRKQVTVLFADLVGFTAMSESMDPEDVREIQQAYIGSVTPAIEQYGGSVEKYIGDAVLAVFGVPRAHEDDPERAIRAALGMQAALDKLNKKLLAERDMTLAMRIGINSGLVVSQVDQANDFVVTGDTVNLAARLQSAAEPDTVLVSEATYLLAVHVVEIESLGSIHVKGKTEPVAIYRVLNVKPEVEKPRGIVGLTSPLVGRERQVETLQRAIDHLSGGQGGLVSVVGGAGIGKSRLVAEVKKYVPRGDLSWVEGRSLSYGGSMAYLPWQEILRGVIGVNVEAQPAYVRERLKGWIEARCPGRIEKIYPYIGNLLSLPLEESFIDLIEDMDGRELRCATFQAVDRLLTCAARERPLVVVCEDLHWVDYSSLALLEHLMPLVVEAPLLLICVFRPRKEHDSWKLMETAAREYSERYVTLQLEPLSTGDSQQLLGNLLGSEGFPRELVKRILGRAEGNPFYVEEIIRSLIDREDLMREEATDQWTMQGDVDQISIPDTLQGVLVARIDRLERDTRRVLQMASVIGRVFLYRVLGAIAEEERSLDEKLLKLRQEELIRERVSLPELEYIFKHALTQEAAYNGILKKHRRTFHRQVGIALESLFPERMEENLGLLAYHWERAGDKDKAVDYLGRAGDHARNMYAHQEAIDFYQRALNILISDGNQWLAARTLMKIGLTYHNAFDFQRSHEVYEEGFKLWAAAKEQSDTFPAAPHPLRMIVGHVDRIDPLKFIGPDEIISHLFSGLLELTPDMDVVPDVANRWEVLDQGRAYRFHLREDVYWTDGTPVTADDFAYTFRKILDPTTQSPAANLLYDIKGAKVFHQGRTSDTDYLGITVSDPFTLLIELEQPAAYFLQLMAISYPVPQHVIERFGERWIDPDKIVTNGPFRLQSWQEGESIYFLRHESYHGAYRGNTSQVVLYFRPWPPREENLQIYESGALDVLDVWDVPQPMANLVIKRYANEMVSFPDLMTVECGFNTRKPPFDQIKVRQAFAMAFDREGLIERTGGQVLPAAGGFIPPGMPGHSPGIGLPYDPGKARQLLAQAGYPDGRNFPAIVATDFPGHNEYNPLQHVAEILEVKIQLEIIERAAFLERLHKDPPQIWNMLGHRADYPDPDNFLRANFPWEATGWQNKTCEHLIEQARGVSDQQERMKLYVQADKIIVEEAAVIPVTYSRHLFLIKPWVSHYPMAPIKTSYWKDVIIKPHE